VTDWTIEGILDGATGAMPGVRRSTAGSSITWAAGDVPFAVVTGSTVELRLDRAIAAAALKTPDTAASARGPEWVRYTPATLEDHDLDRLEAWFALAHRRALEPARHSN
jgi:hypothetical protein